jgi:hypothetical protein
MNACPECGAELTEKFLGNIPLEELVEIEGVRERVLKELRDGWELPHTINLVAHHPKKEKKP